MPSVSELERESQLPYHVREVCRVTGYPRYDEPKDKMYIVEKKAVKCTCCDNIKEHAVFIGEFADKAYANMLTTLLNA